MHNEILELLTPRFFSGGGKSNLRTFCAQTRSEKKLIDRISASYFLEPFTNRYKRTINRYIKKAKKKMELSVVMSYILEPEEERRRILNIMLYRRL